MKRILIVDDSGIARDIVRKILGTGYEYDKAANGEEALAKISEISPDLILLDLLMPGMDGFGVLEKLQEKGNKIPVLLLSADIQKSTREKAFKTGASDLINKPVDPETLRLQVSRLLENPGGTP